MSGKKSVLIERLVQAETMPEAQPGAAGAGAAELAEASEGWFDDQPLNKRKVAELKVICKQRQLPFTSKHKKKDLIKLIEDDIAYSTMMVAADNPLNGEGAVAAPAAPGAAAAPAQGGELSYSEMLDKFLSEAAATEAAKKAAKKKHEFLVKSLNMPPTKYTASGLPATSADVLRKLAGEPFTDPPEYGLAFKHFQERGGDGKAACEAIYALHSMSSIDTMLSNFIEPLRTLADEKSRVHCSMNINTETGRLSARRPNLQNQPALEKDQYRIRSAFSAEEGNQLIVADYGQLELRLLAHITDCRSMIDAFASGGCFHSRTAVGMFPHVRKAVDDGEVLLEWDYSKGEPPAPLLKDYYGSERRKAKTLNFSIAYGKTVHGLSKDWNVSVDEAKEILDAWYADRPEVLDWQKKVKAEARRTGYTRTLMGRYRALPGISVPKLRGHGERAAINTPIQGGAADIVVLAMIKLQRSELLKNLGYKLLLQVHDEVILEGPEEQVDEALAEVRRCMEAPWDDFGLKPLKVELTVDAKFAKTWYEAK